MTAGAAVGMVNGRQHAEPRPQFADAGAPAGCNAKDMMSLGLGLDAAEQWLECQHRYDGAQPRQFLVIPGFALAAVFFIRRPGLPGGVSGVLQPGQRYADFLTLHGRSQAQCPAQHWNRGAGHETHLQAGFPVPGAALGRARFDDYDLAVTFGRRARVWKGRQKRRRNHQNHRTGEVGGIDAQPPGQGQNLVAKSAGTRDSV